MEFQVFMIYKLMEIHDKEFKNQILFEKKKLFEKRELRVSKVNFLTLNFIVLVSRMNSDPYKSAFILETGIRKFKFRKFTLITLSSLFPQPKSPT